MNIHNFTSGLISSAAFSSLRDVSAADAENVKNDDEGALITRNGLRVLPADGDTVVAIFTHAGYVLVVTGEGELKWETETEVLSKTDTLFQSFIPPRRGLDANTVFVAFNDDVFLSNPYVQLKVAFPDGERPEAHLFYLPILGNITVRWSDVNPEMTRVQYRRGRHGSATSYQRPQETRGGVYLRLQPVKTIPQADEPFFFNPIEAVGRSSVTENRVPEGAVLDFGIAADDLVADSDADYIDVFQTLSTAADADAEYYFIGRIPHAVGTYRLSVIADLQLETERTLVEPIAEPDWQLVEASEERLYLATGQDNKIYMTYYDTAEQYLRSVTDSFDVKTDGRKITGIKLLNDDLLAVYTSNKIYIYALDPIAELHQRVKTIATRDHRDAPIGCIAPESLVDIDGFHYFLSGTRQVYRFDGQSTAWVSEPVNSILEAIPRNFASKAIGFARDREYCLAYPSTPDSRENDAMLRYHTLRKIWWKDSFRLSDISKGQSQDEYAVIGNQPALLNVGTSDGEAHIAWRWRGNKILLPLNTLIHSLFVGVLPEDIGADVLKLSVSVKTEEGEQTETFEVRRALNFWEQVVGFNLRGRSAQVTLSGEGAMKIDRLQFNPQP